MILDAESTGHHPEWEKLILNALPSGKVFARTADLRAATADIGPGGQLTLLRLNTFLLPLLSGALRGSEVALSGIWFGPQSASWVYGGSARIRLRGLLELYRIRKLRRVAGLRRLYLLNDARTAAFMQRIVRLPEGVHRLADPIGQLPQVSVAEAAAERKRLGIANNTRVLAVLGAMRKGKFGDVRLAAGGIIPGDVIILAGEVVDGFRPELEAIIRSWEAAGVRVVTQLRRLDDAAFARILALSDVVWLPYRNVYGSSGMLGHAAAARKRVVAPREGLLGALVREYGLDRADPAGTARYCADNAPERFVGELLA